MYLVSYDWYVPGIVYWYFLYLCRRLRQNLSAIFLPLSIPRTRNRTGSLTYVYLVHDIYSPSHDQGTRKHSNFPFPPGSHQPPYTRPFTTTNVRTSSSSRQRSGVIALLQPRRILLLYCCIRKDSNVFLLYIRVYKHADTTGWFRLNAQNCFPD